MACRVAFRTLKWYLTACLIAADIAAIRNNLATGSYLYLVPYNKIQRLAYRDPQFVIGSCQRNQSVLARKI